MGSRLGGLEDSGASMGAMKSDKTLAPAENGSMFEVIGPLDRSGGMPHVANPGVCEVAA